MPPAVLPGSSSTDLDVRLWGGECVFNGTTVSLSITCPIDGILYSLIRLLKELKGNYDHPAITLLLATAAQIEKYGWVYGRVHWLCNTNIERYKVQSDAPKVFSNCHNTEYANVIKYVEDVYTCESKSTCSNKDC